MCSQKFNFDVPSILQKFFGAVKISMPQVEILIIAFVFLVIMCMVDPRWYFLVVLAGLIMMAIFRPDRSRFADGDIEDMKLGQVLSADGTYINLNTVGTTDLDSSADIDAVLANSPTITNGDDLLTQQMQNVAGRTKEAIIARSRFTSDNFRRYFQEELDACEQQHWWEDDSLVEGTVRDGHHHESDRWDESAWGDEMDVSHLDPDL
jgi:hypothetical protein